MHLLIAAAPTPPPPPHLKWHYSTGAINDDFCSVDWGRNIGPLSLSPTQGIWQFKISPLTGNLDLRQKMPMPMG